MRRSPAVALVLSLSMFPAIAWSATYTVGPSGRQYTQLSTVFANNNINAGDIIEVDGNATYSGNIVVNSDDGGAAGNPVIIRWKRAAGQSRPVLQGGTNTIKFQRSNYVVLEGFEITGGSNTCIFSEAHEITVRDTVIRDCPSHGILAADQNSGSFTLEYSEVRTSGSGTQRHPIYMQSDEVAYPGAVFRMQFNYLHDGNGGNLVKVRHERAEIYYNWLEGSAYQALELIGPDCYTQQSGWTPTLRREDADIVGNVIVQSGSWANAIRIGGDLNGRSQGRVRLVNNTILFTRSGSANAVLVQLGAGSLEMHNNVIHQTSSEAPAVLVENTGETPYCAPTGTSPWDAGRKVAGSSNWVKTGTRNVPTEWTGTRNGSDPGLAGIAGWNLRPTASSVLVGNGSNPPVTPSAFPLPSPLSIPLYDPPSRAKLDLNGARQRTLTGGRLSIGALESTAGDSTPTEPVRVNGSQPLVPGGASAIAPAAAVPAQGSAPATSVSALVPATDDAASSAADTAAKPSRRISKYARIQPEYRVRRWSAPAREWCDTETSVEGGRSICGPR